MPDLFFWLFQQLIFRRGGFYSNKPPCSLGVCSMSVCRFCEFQDLLLRAAQDRCAEQDGRFVSFEKIATSNLTFWMPKKCIFAVGTAHDGSMYHELS